jgi:hypothetical protein
MFHSLHEPYKNHSTSFHFPHYEIFLAEKYGFAYYFFISAGSQFYEPIEHRLLNPRIRLGPELDAVAR